MNVVVAGGAGFLGSHVVDLLLADPANRVTVIDALTYAGSRENLEAHRNDPRLAFVEADIAEEGAADPHVAEADLVLNLAAESFVDRSIAESRPFARTNVLGTLALLTACRRHGRTMVQVSTDEVYGSIERGSFSEDSPLRPNNPYAATKAGADLLCRSFHHTYGMDVRVMRGCNAFGPRQHAEKAIPTFVGRALAGQPLPVYGDGSNRREWLFAEDFARAVLVVAQHGEPGGVYNAGGGHEVSNLDLARLVCELAGAPESLIHFVEDRPGHDLRYALEWERLAALGWKPEVGFREGLEATVDWFRRHPHRLRRGLGGGGR